MTKLCSIFLISCQKLYLSNTLGLGNAKKRFYCQSWQKLGAMKLKYIQLADGAVFSYEKQCHLLVNSNSSNLLIGAFPNSHFFEHGSDLIKIIA